MKDLEDVVTKDVSLSETSSESTEDEREKESTVCLRTKRKLLSTKVIDAWQPDSCKKPLVSVRRLSRNELVQRLSEKSTDASKDEQKPKPRRGKRKWTDELDQCLKDGVGRHGPGRWSRILMDHDFEGRTGIMLKDRWRVLTRNHLV
ncbi:Telomeric repeat-binding factor 1 TTAGGG repeat-binding factor 1 [Collichthys lucidus]|uniref:Telomeric repeat-binding factor 1 TTAGGG repeat-binding factor 1 n=1 Tax=Collichthys lucidus TaxID=240159 RepID=A0A4U5VHN7_COLLU|nr:Telomeric repeat-binding factor 1 TTAGGG repeat-binding factor 1 [Collichthys lucidus]